MTPLAQNQFISHSAAEGPAESAVASKPPPAADATAAPSDGQDVPAKMQESKARHSGLACDDEKPGDTMQESRPAHPATAPSDDIPEIFRVANYLCRHDSRFAPDRAAIWDAMFDETAPRLRVDDPVWTDDAPLFIRDGEHLRRWG